MPYQDASIIALLMGLLGGVASHIAWMVATLREQVSKNGQLSLSKKAIRARSILFLLTCGGGILGGFVVGTVVYEPTFPVGRLVGLTFLAGAAFDTAVALVRKFSGV